MNIGLIVVGFILGLSAGYVMSALLAQTRISVALGNARLANVHSGKLSRIIGGQRRKIRELKAQLLPYLPAKPKPLTVQKPQTDAQSH